MNAISWGADALDDFELDGIDLPDEPMRRANTVLLSDVKPEVVQWLWPGRIPLGKLSVIDGDPGLGKSLLTLDIAARLSIGATMPDGSAGDVSGPAAVLLVNVEDAAADTLRPRIDLAGGNPRLFTSIESVQGHDGHDRPVVLPDDWGVIEQEVTAARARLIVLDPLMALLGGEVNSFRDQDVRRALLPGVKLAEATGAALLVVRHLNKASGSAAIYRGGGSVGISGAARSVLVVGKDPNDPTEERRILVGVKQNLSAPKPALAYRVDSHDGLHPRIVWDGEASITANQLLAQPANGDERGAATQEAEDFLREVLYHGPRPTKDVLRESRSLGISEATLRRTRERLGVLSRKQGFGDRGEWVLELPFSAKAPKALIQNDERLSGLDAKESTENPYPEAKNAKAFID